MTISLLTFVVDYSRNGEGKCNGIARPVLEEAGWSVGKESNLAANLLNPSNNTTTSCKLKKLLLLVCYLLSNPYCCSHSIVPSRQ